MTFFAGLDLGQTNDPSALVIGEVAALRVLTPHEAERQAGVDWITEGTPAARQQVAPVDMDHVRVDIRFIKRFDLKMSYVKIVAETKILMEQPELANNCTLGIDATGVGTVVVDIFRDGDIPASIIPIWMTSGKDVTKGKMGRINIPQRDLALGTQLILQKRLLKINARLESAKILEQELLNFRAKIKSPGGGGGHDSFEAWREKDHDDLVFATAIMIWLVKNTGLYQGIRVV